MAPSPRLKLRGTVPLVAAVAALALTVPAAGASAATTDRAASAAAKAQPRSPWVGPREDETPDGDADAANALCRDIADGSLSFSYGRPRAGEVDAIVRDRVNNSGEANLGCTTPQNETTIAVNPRNPHNLVAGANDYRVCCDFLGRNDGTG